MPYEVLTAQQIMLRISLSTSQPVLKLRWDGEEVSREDIALEFKSVLKEKFWILLCYHWEHSIRSKCHSPSSRAARGSSDRSHRLQH
jgi:hypothetical protein